VADRRAPWSGRSSWRWRLDGDAADACLLIVRQEDGVYLLFWVDIEHIWGCLVDCACLQGDKLEMAGF